MSEPLFNPSCEVVQEQLAAFVSEQAEHGVHFRPTGIFALYAPDAGPEGKVALTRSSKAMGQETLDEALKPAQGGIKVGRGEDITGAFERELSEELRIGTNGLRVVYGLPMGGYTMTSHSHHSGRANKAFGVLCGVAYGELPLEPNPQELISAGWYDIAETERVFLVQARHPKIYERGFRNLMILDAITSLGLRASGGHEE